MSNLSLKEQLQALSIAAAPASNEKVQPQKKKLKQGDNTKGAKQKPAWLEHAQYGVELLKAYFPNCFKEAKDVKPLKVGIKQDLVKNLGAREDIVSMISMYGVVYYVNSIAYHKSISVGVMH